MNFNPDNYDYYAIQDRKFTSNALFGVKRGSKEDKKEIILMSSLPKKEGDHLINDILEYLSSKKQINHS